MVSSGFLGGPGRPAGSSLRAQEGLGGRRGLAGDPPHGGRPGGFMTPRVMSASLPMTDPSLTSTATGISGPTHG